MYVKNILKKSVLTFSIFSLSIFSFYPVTVFAANKDVEMVKDINHGESSSTPNWMIQSGETIFFRADDGIHGVELWKTDGTEDGTVLVKDIYDGSSSGFPVVPIAYNGVIIFRANDGENGLELWRSDGTEEGTYMIKDIRSGSSGSTPDNFAAYNGEVYFSANDGVNGLELWKTDGTEEGTVMVKDIRSGTTSAAVQYFLEMNDVLYFSANDGVNGIALWKTDGTEEGTVMVKDMNPDSLLGGLYLLASAGDVLYFRAASNDYGVELWKTDGTEEGTIMVKDINEGSGDSTPSNLGFYNGEFYFSANDGVSGVELWKTDGTEVGTVQVMDINPGVGNSSPVPLTSFNGNLLFYANDGVNGLELWKTDGTEEGTVMVKDISEGAGSGFAGYLNVVNNVAYFAGNDGVTGMEWWRTDGTEAGTELYAEINESGSASISSVVRWGDTLYFSATDGISGAELWKLTPVSESEPLAPDNLATASVTTNSLTLSWNDMSDNETGFVIESSTNGTDFTSLTTTAADVSSYSVTNLTPNTQYRFRVAAINDVGISEYTSISVTTLRAGGGAPIVPVAPRSPSGSDLTFTLNGGKEITTTRTVSVSLRADEATVKGYVISLDPSFEKESIHPYAPITTFTLPENPGTYTVYLKYYSITGHYSPVVSAVVQYSPQTVTDPVKPTPDSSSVGEEFLRNLRLGDRGEDVKRLQRFLNAQGFTVALNGAGAPGQETTLFGPLTRQAVIAYQEKYASIILTPLGLRQGTGNFFSATRAFVNGLLTK